MKNEGGNSGSQGIDRIHRLLAFLELLIAQHGWYEGDCVIGLYQGEITKISTTITQHFALGAAFDSNSHEAIIPLDKSATLPPSESTLLIQKIHECFDQELDGCRLQFGTIEISIKRGMVSRIKAATLSKPTEDRQLTEFLFGG